MTIEHREQAAGLGGQRRRYFVDCTVEFSQEERAIIKARDLYEHTIAVRPAEPLPTRLAVFGAGVLPSIGSLLILGGIGYALYAAFTNPSGEFWGGLVFAIGVGLHVYGWWASRRQDKRLETGEQIIKLRTLLTAPRFTVYAVDPAAAKAAEDDIRTALLSLKQLLQESAEIKSKQTFEL